jgi:hypothetical protein
VRTALTTLLLLLLGAEGARNFEVRVAGEKVTILAKGAFLADILDRLAEQTGMKLVYDGPRPRERVTVKIEGVSAAAAVTSLLESRGISSALTFAPNGRDIATLIIVDARAGAGSAPVRPSSGPSPVASPPVRAIDPEQASETNVSEPEESVAPTDLPQPFVPPMASYPAPPESRRPD